MILINGKELQKEILKKVEEEIKNLPFVPVFCDVLVGDDPVSAQYVRMKAKMAESIGIKFQNASFPISITNEDLIKEIEILNDVPNMCGIIVQLPLPASLDKRVILDAIDSKLDVDCLGSIASGEFYRGKTTIGFPTAMACMQVIDSLNFDLSHKNIVVLGQGDLVGKPVTALLQFRNLNPIIINSKTENKEEILKNADVIFSGVGKGKYINGSMIKKDAILIDAGTSEDGNSVVGDVDLESVKDVASFVSPVPGGVGPVTVAMLLQNVLSVAKRRMSTEDYVA